jgi:hypothetical protein
MIIRGLQLDPEGACETSKDSPCAEGAVGDFVMAEIQGLQEEGGLDLDRYKEAVEGAGGGRGGPRMPLKDSARVNYPGGASGLGLSAETPKLKRWVCRVLRRGSGGSPSGRMRMCGKAFVFVYEVAVGCPGALVPILHR